MSKENFVGLIKFKTVSREVFHHFFDSFELNFQEIAMVSMQILTVSDSLTQHQGLRFLIR